MKLAKNPPSQESQVIQSALNKAIANALEKKRKLGQYAVMWENNRVIYKGADAPDRHPPQMNGSITKIRHPNGCSFMEIFSMTLLSCRTQLDFKMSSSPINMNIKV